LKSCDDPAEIIFGREGLTFPLVSGIRFVEDVPSYMATTFEFDVPVLLNVMVTLVLSWNLMFSDTSSSPARVVVVLMYVITQAYVTTMAATAITINSNVASIGDMAFLDFNMFLVDMSSPFVV
jgi:hypothetical protein